MIAIVCSDIHLSHTPPIARSAEPSWYDAMLRPLKELQELQKHHKNVPVVMAGDIFDKWNAPAELINFAMENIPKSTYAIPGQHDMPGHNFDSINRSAYWTLVKAGTIEHLPSGIEITDFNYELTMMGFQWGHPIQLPQDFEWSNDKTIKLAVIHKYAWMFDHRYEGAPDQDKGKHIVSKVRNDFDAFVFGDNHKRWTYQNLMNCGVFHRRSIDEISYTPAIGILRSDGSLHKHILSSSAKDKFIDIDKLKKVGDRALNLLEFVGDLQSLGSGAIDFVEAVKEAISVKNIARSVAVEILHAIGES